MSFKSIAAMALLAVTVSVQAQSGAGEPSRAAPAARAEACGAAGQPACADERQPQVDKGSNEPGGMALAGAALAVVAFVALRRGRRQ